MDEKINRIEELVKYLNECSYSYFVLDDPIIDDKKYDKLYDELKSLERKQIIFYIIHQHKELEMLF